MLNSFRSLFINEAQASLDSKVICDESKDEIPRYPPFAKGLPAVSTNQIIESQSELIKLIYGTLSFSSAEFDQLVLPVINNFAEFVHLLPASEAHHHRGAGGLFRHGLEVACWTARFSESAIFSLEGSPKERRNNEPRWILASCLSGLLHDVGKPLSDVSVSNDKGSVIWNPYAHSLVKWTKIHCIDNYYLRWTHNRYKRHEKFSLLALERMLPSGVLAYLSATGSKVLEALLTAVGGTDTNQPMAKMMLKADQESVSKDLKQNRINLDEYSYGVPVERYILDAIRRLINQGQWSVNEVGAKVWNSDQGVFIVWKCLHDLYKLLDEDKIPGIPRHPDTLADILLERGLAISNEITHKNGQVTPYRYWQICPEILQNTANFKDPIKLQVLRIESQELIFTQAPASSVKAIIYETDNCMKDSNRTEAETNNTVSKEKSECIQDESKNNSMVSQTLKLDQKKSYEKIRSKKTDNEAKPLFVKARLLDYLDKLPECARVILKMALLPILSGDKVLGDQVGLMEGQPLIIYPNGVEQLGDPEHVIKCLWDAGVISSDPIMPGKKIQVLGGTKGLVFSSTLSQLIIEAFKETQCNEVNQDNKIGECSEVEEVTVRSPDSTLSKIFDNQIRPKVSLESVIAQLKEMILSGEGKWLASPVVKEKEHFVTCGSSLDLITREYPMLSKHNLRGHLKRGQNKPLLFYKAGKLYLEVDDAL